MQQRLSWKKACILFDEADRELGHEKKVLGTAFFKNNCYQ